VEISNYTVMITIVIIVIATMVLITSGERTLIINYLRSVN